MLNKTRSLNRNWLCNSKGGAVFVVGHFTHSKIQKIITGNYLTGLTGFSGFFSQFPNEPEEIKFAFSESS